MMKRFAMLLAGALLCALTVQLARAQERLRISLDTNPNHIRNESVEIFAQELKKRVGDRIQVEVFPSAQLYRDRDVPRALRQGSVEMGIPGTWQLDGVAPSTAITSLPMFYGVDAETVHKLVDGKLGEAINRNIEERLGVKVLGRWFDLGFNHLYSTANPIRQYADIEGKKVRIPGGSANAARIRALGGSPVLIPWPDLPLAMNQGVVDALITTHESAFTAKLWDSGMRHAFEDREFFAQYVPMLNRRFWNRLSPELQKAVTEAWDVAVEMERRNAAKAQADARQVLIEHGVQMAQPSEEAAAAARRRLLAVQDQVVSDMKIERDLVELAAQQLREANVDF